MTMTVGGLNTILSSIEDEADKAVEKILSSAKSEADSIIKSAERQAEEMKHDAEQKAKAVFNDTLERGNNSLEHSEKQQILAEKQRLLSKSIAEAAEKIKEISDKEYFNFMKSLLKRYITDSELHGVLLMNENDIKRMTPDFKSMLDEEYKNIEIGTDNSVKSGFKVKCGDIEDNCTIDALVEAEADYLKEKIGSILFV